MVSTLKLTSLLVAYFLTLTTLIVLISPVLSTDPLSGDNLTDTSDINSGLINVTNTPDASGTWSTGAAFGTLFKFFTFQLDLGISGLAMFVIQTFFVYLPLLLFLMCMYFSIRSGN